MADIGSGFLPPRTTHFSVNNMLAPAMRRFYLGHGQTIGALAKLLMASA
jgi:hypothetical protein